GVTRSSRTRGGMRWTRVRRRAFRFAAGQAQGWVFLQANIKNARTTGVTRLSSTTFEGWYEVPRRSLAAMARGRPSRVVLAPLKGVEPARGSNPLIAGDGGKISQSP